MFYYSSCSIPMNDNSLAELGRNETRWSSLVARALSHSFSLLSALARRTAFGMVRHGIWKKNVSVLYGRPYNVENLHNSSLPEPMLLALPPYDSDNETFCFGCVESITTGKTAEEIDGVIGINVQQHSLQAIFFCYISNAAWSVYLFTSAVEMQCMQWWIECGKNEENMRKSQFCFAFSNKGKKKLGINWTLTSIRRLMHIN